MKRYIKSVSKPDKYYKDTMYRSNEMNKNRYACYDSSGKRMLKCIRHMLMNFPNTENMTYLPKKIRDMQSDTCIVVRYRGTLNELQHDVCKIIRDMAKRDYGSITPRIVGDQVRYRPDCSTGNPPMVNLTFTKITLKVVEKYDFDVYKITL